MTNRRSFLRGLLAAPAIVAASSLMPVSARFLVPALALPPKLWGDGIHDDTAALQWLIDNKGGFSLPGMSCRISEPLVAKDGAVFHGATLLHRNGAIVVPENTKSVRIMNLQIIGSADGATHPDACAIQYLTTFSAHNIT